MDILIPVYDTTNVYEVKKNTRAFNGMTLDGQVSPSSVKLVYYKFPIDLVKEDAVSGEVVKNFEKKIIDVISASFVPDATLNVEIGTNTVTSLTDLDVAENKVTVPLHRRFTLSYTEDRRGLIITGQDVEAVKGILGLLLLVEETIRQ